MITRHLVPVASLAARIVLLCSFWLGFFSPAHAQGPTASAMDGVAAAGTVGDHEHDAGEDSYSLRLSTELGVWRGSAGSMSAHQPDLAEPVAKPGNDASRRFFARTIPATESDDMTPVAARRFVPPPGELNTSGVMRAGRMALEDGVPVLQRDEGEASNQAPLIRTESDD